MNSQAPLKALFHFAICTKIFASVNNMGFLRCHYRLVAAKTEQGTSAAKSHDIGGWEIENAA
jgi:hypothetical protein